MSELRGRDRARYVRSMFGRIARRYDLLNRLMTVGQDRRWRRSAVSQLSLAAGSRILDIGSGTGDLAFEVLRQQPRSQVFAADFTPQMVSLGKNRTEGRNPAWLLADALHLPFAAGSFSGVISGFLLRNVPEVGRVIEEQVRVLDDGGRMVSLETSPPQSGILRPLLSFHFHVVIPLLGWLVVGAADAYRYLPATTEGFHDPASLSGMLRDAGLRAVGFRRIMLGTIAVHWGMKGG
jgi:demethylmenaquinone methyltransferase/2-methoxy-6-polyprenyl-1,4-benzoquinol methylase